MSAADFLTKYTMFRNVNLAELSFSNNLNRDGTNSPVS